MWSARVYQILQAHNLILHNKGGQCWQDSREPAIWCRISWPPFLALKKCHTCQLCKRCHEMLMHVISKLSKDAARWLRGDGLCVRIHMCLHRLLERHLNFSSSWNQVMRVHVQMYEGVKRCCQGGCWNRSKAQQGQLSLSKAFGDQCQLLSQSELGKPLHEYLIKLGQSEVSTRAWDAMGFLWDGRVSLRDGLHLCLASPLSSLAEMLLALLTKGTAGQCQGYLAPCASSAPSPAWSPQTWGAITANGLRAQSADLVQQLAACKSRQPCSSFHLSSPV